MGSNRLIIRWTGGRSRNLSGSEEAFGIQEEHDPKVCEYATSNNIVTLCMIAPFAPTKVSPTRQVFAQLTYPDEFTMEDFISAVETRYPNKDKRPPLCLLLHSPGGTVSSSYVVARLLRNHFNQIISYVPHVAASGASLMCLASNEIVMGDISQLTGIDPCYTSGRETVYAISVVRAFKTLEEYFGTRSVEDAPYPWKRLMDSITAEKYDQATHAMEMVESYAGELMTKAGYKAGDIDKVVRALLYDVTTHEQVFPLDAAKELGLKAVRFSEDAGQRECWGVMKYWLKQYYLTPSAVHIIRYAIPKESPQADTAK